MSHDDSSSPCVLWGCRVVDVFGLVVAAVASVREVCEAGGMLRSLTDPNCGWSNPGVPRVEYTSEDAGGVTCVGRSEKQEYAPLPWKDTLWSVLTLLLDACDYILALEALTSMNDT